ncbi:MAG: hypothetical protein GX893_07995 [Firmicutes bacterium]|nr:hypothetical protein [Bacillota bacterium]
MSKKKIIDESKSRFTGIEQTRTALFRELRKAGICYIKDIPWGTHLCVFYETDRDLIDIAAQYFRAGLENNEYCVWIVPESISPAVAVSSLQKVIPNFALYLQQLEILKFSEFYLNNGNFNRDNILSMWEKKVAAALAEGYEGLRVLGCTSWVKKKHWQVFMEYEAAINKALATLQIIGLCPYPLVKYSKHEMLEIVSNHNFAFLKSRFDENTITDLAKYERIELVGKMAAGIAHEIRNPMTAVKGFIQLLQSKKELADYNDYFSLMIDELDRANDIITEYLSLAREKAKDIKEHNLNDILRAIYPLLQATAVRENVDLVLSTGVIKDVYVDAKDVRQVILNLARNALEAMPGGGILAIKTYMASDKVVLEVSDTGCGIPQEILDNLGKPFLTTKENGTGLGLPVSMKILDSYNASVNIKSSSDGTTFIIYFPSKGSDV